MQYNTHKDKYMHIKELSIQNISWNSVTNGYSFIVYHANAILPSWLTKNIIAKDAKIRTTGADRK